MKTHTATFVQTVTVTDPDTNTPVKVAIYKHDNAGWGMFGVDQKFIDDNFDNDETPTVADPFNNECILELINW